VTALTDAPPLADPGEEAMRLAQAANDRSLVVRVIGGVAIRLRAPTGTPASLTRTYKDIDVVTTSAGGRRMPNLFDELGYRPDREFNALHGGDRMLFYDDGNQRQIDVFVGSFRMCHEIDLSARLELDPITVPLAELLLTKLQIVQLNEKDQRDIFALLHDHPVTDHDRDAINVSVVAQACAGDWGLWRTTQGTLSRSRESLGNYELTDEQRTRVQGGLDELEGSIEREPKSRRWRWRARIGERTRWYEEPDEVG
jgi:hypothetical protein